MNLLTKLSEKFKNMSNETKKRIAATMLAGTMAFSGLGMAGCKDSNNTTNNNGSSIQTPGGDSSNTGGNQNSGNGNNQNSGNGGTQTPDYSKYSQILQNVLTDKYYSDLIITDKVASKDYGNMDSYDDAKYKAIPFGFLEDEGYDIEKVKNNIVDAESNLYTIGNDLFVELRIETKASTNYYTHYVVKYTLTEQEINELDSLFVPRYNSRFDTRVTNYQAPFFVQEISYQKQATKLSEMHMTKDAVEAVECYFDRNNYNTSFNHIMYLKQEIVDDFLQTTFHTFQTHAFIDGISSNQAINCKGKLNTITLETPGTCSSRIDSKFVFTNDDDFINFYLYKDKKLEYEQSTVDINLYSCENANFVELDSEEFNNDLAK